MAYDEEKWWLTDSHPDAAAHREFLASKGGAAKPPPSRRKAAPTRRGPSAEVIAEVIARATAPLQKRLAALEAKPVVEFKGPWQSKKPYRQGSLVVCDGSCWFAKDGGTGNKPGTDQGAKQWQLVAKKGRDGKDLR